MDLVTESLVNTFKTDEGLDILDQPTVFEHFANHCIVSYEYPEEFDVETIHVAGGNDLGLDGVGIIVNGILVDSIEEIDDLVSTNKFLDALFIFVQSKSGKTFEGSEISNMFYGIRDLFSNEPRLPRNEQLQHKENLIRHIYSKSSFFKQHGNPKLKLYYVTTGKWLDDDKLKNRVGTELASLDDLVIFSDPAFEPVDARKLQNLYSRANNALTKTFNFLNKVTLPPMDGVREAYLGFINAKEYVKLITDDNLTLLRGLFYDNVRDYQGDNPVNQEIEQTLKRDDKNAFVLLNNGVTIVSEDLKITSSSFTLKSFQIVNGCQTSHVLYNNQGLLNENICIPIKLIVAPNSALKNQVIKATNRQTVVKTEELSALTDFQKYLEEFYNSIPILHKLNYERRSQQFGSSTPAEKATIVTIPGQIRSFASMFLGRAHQASRYYGTLLRDIEDKIFVDGHPPLAYYVSAYTLYKVEIALKKKLIEPKYRAFKFHLLGIIRMIIGGVTFSQMVSNQFSRDCEKLKVDIWDDAKFQVALNKACKVLDEILADDFSRDRAKDSSIAVRAQAIIQKNNAESAIAISENSPK